MMGPQRGRLRLLVRHLEQTSLESPTASPTAAQGDQRRVDGRRDRGDDRLERQTAEVLDIPPHLRREAPPILLGDDQVQRFIVDGYVLIDAAFESAPVHSSVFDKLEAAFELDGNDGANVLPRVPDISHVYDHPAVRGGLQSLLGKGCV